MNLKTAMLCCGINDIRLFCDRRYAVLEIILISE